MEILEFACQNLLYVALICVYFVIRPFLIQWLREKEWYYLFEIVETGILIAQKTYVDKKKELSADGKLTEDEADEARKIAKDFVFEYYSKIGIDILKKYSEKIIDGIIENSLVNAKNSRIID